MPVTERQILRRMFGPTKERDDTWRIETNYELNDLITDKNIIHYIKTERLNWFGYTHTHTYVCVCVCISNGK
jgi:hypothetical protein